MAMSSLTKIRLGVFLKTHQRDKIKLPARLPSQSTARKTTAATNRKSSASLWLWPRPPIYRPHTSNMTSAHVGLNGANDERYKLTIVGFLLFGTLSYLCSVKNHLSFFLFIYFFSNKFLKSVCSVIFLMLTFLNGLSICTHFNTSFTFSFQLLRIICKLFSFIFKNETSAEAA